MIINKTCNKKLNGYITNSTPWEMHHNHWSTFSNPFQNVGEPDMADLFPSIQHQVGVKQQIYMSY